ncbi:MAG TPA: CADD family putative folate metabolism protein [Candidatus Acidoferrales bacterium]|nr:CADD family putative folate metabolism protein [Candidatus Acidoferrales bacterium]
MEKVSNGLVEGLDALVAKWHLLGHPFYQAWTAGTLTREALQLYAEQYYHHVKAFPDNLRTLAGRTEGELRGIIEENLAEEENPVAPHPKLWREFAEAVGVAEARMDESSPLPGIEKLLATYRQQALTGSTAAVAALYVYEAQVPEIATKKIEGLKRFYGVTEPRGLRYFAVHEEADVRHRAAWKQWLEQQPAAEAEPAVRAGEEALQALWGALDAVTPEGCSGLRPPQQPSAER